MILQGDCREVMRGMEANSVDAIVTDPPYELGFMGKSWDRSGISFQPSTWALAYKLLKPGGHLLAFGSSRTYHRLACAIEDAGFEIRDQIMWVYGSGFPKSRNVSKAIDKEAGHKRGTSQDFRNGPNTINGTKGDKYSLGYAGQSEIDTGPITEAARQWQGWGTAIKPAHEPIVLARKPLVGTVAANVLEHGTGAINIDGCLIEGRDRTEYGLANAIRSKVSTYGAPSLSADFDSSKGRWPANLIHDGSEEVEAAFAAFGEKKGQSGAVTGYEQSSKTNNVYGSFNGRPATEPRGDTGTASRFFYCAKASKADRDDGLEGLPERTDGKCRGEMASVLWPDGSLRERVTEPAARRNPHATVKPTTLMRYLCRLITPPGGTVLDPFAGSGSTGRGAVLEGFKFIGIELDPGYAEIARLRIAAAEAKANEDQRIAETQQLALWGGP